MNHDSETPLTPEESQDRPSETPPNAEAPVVEPADAAIQQEPEPTVGTGSYIAVSCTLGMLVLTVILIGVVFLLRWIG